MKGSRPRTTKLPAAFKVWAAGALVSQLGDSALYFGLGWAASSDGGTVAGLVLSMISLPRTLLLLIGGAVGDRTGARRIMLIGDSVMLVVAATLAISSWSLGTPIVILLIAAFIIGTNDAFYLPAAGSMPRLLVDAGQVSRAVALRQSGSQLVTIVGGPLGGVLVALAGLPIAAAVDTATFAVVIVVLFRIRPRFEPEPAPARRNILREAVDGVRVALRTAGLRAVLCLMAGAAGFILPVSSLLVPLLSRSRGWPALDAGLIVGAQSLGTIAITLAVAYKGTIPRPGIVASAGMAAVTLSLLCLGLSTMPSLAVASGFFCGVGVGLLVSHLTPVLVTAAPKTHLARVQALFTLVQSSALLITNNLIGNIAHAFSARTGFLTCAAVVCVCALGALLSPALRHMVQHTTDAEFRPANAETAGRAIIRRSGRR